MFEIDQKKKKTKTQQIQQIFVVIRKLVNLAFDKTQIELHNRLKPSLMNQMEHHCASNTQQSWPVVFFFMPINIRRFDRFINTHNPIEAE